MFLKNCWYVAAEADEINLKPLARTVCNEKLVFWRTEAGDPVVFEDRCCHRRLPLRKGLVEGDRLRCHYHGLEFDRDGMCVRVPGQTTVPPDARVRKIPAVERYNAFLAKRLPAYMTPSHFIAHDRLPTTSTGKILRRELHTLETGDQAAAE